MVRHAHLLAHFLAPLTLVLIPLSGSAQLGSLPPNRETIGDASLLTFRADLIRALQQRDTAFLITIVAPHVANGFGGDPGLDQFREYWFESQDSKMDQLREALELGGTFSDSTYSVPYYADRFPSQFDAASSALVLGKRVHVRSSPTLRSPIIATLTYAIVSLPEGWSRHLDPDGHSDLVWLQIGVGGGRIGFVAERYVRSPIGLRVTFMKRNGRWVLTGWAEGD
jgi:hypothetical protein